MGRFWEDRASGRAAALAAAGTFALLGAGFAIAAPGGNGGNPGGLNNGGNSPSGGNASCVSGTPEACRLNPTGEVKACAPVPGNGCHKLPETPCERGHGLVKAQNKHCGPGVTTPPPGGGNPPPGGGNPHPGGGNPPPPGGGTTPTSAPGSTSPGAVAGAGAGSPGAPGTTPGTAADTATPAPSAVLGDRAASPTRRRGTASPARAVERSARFAG
jgi:hypothetical protein